ncbi:cytochrome oxidase c assembly-domain-containing protein [Plectosphaerella cucumerina]|uniref:Cytochrome oxidase c assembly-domain-containing protein n=1 Tax=Plectosphaerella cucumerina TaxID=40658 RepID=A0A8K0TPA5_9PEZI|nr:cytochrome oxidase c assembly-domain-containing protein [Plectosphaerella cucumerina]
MASRVSPRSASDATRFTSTTPHASSKQFPSAAASTPSKASGPSPGGNAPRPASGRTLPRSGETPEERVRRLRAAHEAARTAQVSKVDRALGGGRRFFDLAHRFTIAGLLGFTALAGIVSVYSVYDMVTYNRTRRDDFSEAKKVIETDALASARLAFIAGTATEQQILLVEDANRKAAEAGVKLPPLLAPRAATPPSQPAAAAAPAPVLDAAQREALLQEAERSQGKTPSSSWWPLSSSTTATAEPTIRETAQAAFEKEKANQRQGGPLDQVGLKPEEKKKGWW